MLVSYIALMKIVWIIGGERRIMTREKKEAFAVGVPSWLRNVKDKDVFAAVSGLIIGHKIG